MYVVSSSHRASHIRHIHKTFIPYHSLLGHIFIFIDNTWCPLVVYNVSFVTYHSRYRVITHECVTRRTGGLGAYDYFKTCESFGNYILIVISSYLRLLKVFPSPYQQTTGKADKQVRFSKFTPENSSQELIRLTLLE